jgi:hypothetical protein
MGKRVRNIIVVAVQAPEGLRCHAARGKTSTFVDASELQGGGAYVQFLTKKELNAQYPEHPKFHDGVFMVQWVEKGEH